MEFPKIKLSANTHTHTPGAVKLNTKIYTNDQLPFCNNKRIQYITIMKEYKSPLMNNEARIIQNSN